MSRIRSFARATGILALIAMLVAPSAAWHTGGDDPACELDLVVQHDANAHRVEAAQSASRHAPQHCWLCHFNRWNRAVAEEAALLAVQVQPVAVVSVRAYPPAINATVGLLPGRSPPA